MSLNNPLRTTSWFNKFVECLYLYIAVTSAFSIFLTIFFYKYLSRLNKPGFLPIFYYASLIFILVAFAYSVYWHRKEKSGLFNSEIKHAWLRGVMRYFLALDVSTYGFGKIFKTQFGHLYSREDLPIGSLNGFELTWNYFGHSYTFAVILGVLQISGSILLLFRRTILSGVFILLPVMVNIVLIDIFYHIPTGALINALIITFGLLYLLLLRWNDLKALFFNKPAEIPVMSLEFLKPLARFLTIAAAFFYIYRVIATIPPTAFEGKWKVDEYKRNGKVIDKNNWQVNPESWCKVYIETWGQLSLSPNPYRFDKDRAWFGSYQYDAGKKILKIIFKDTPTDTTKVKISNDDGKTMQWNTVVYGDTLQMKLIKE